MPENPGPEDEFLARGLAVGDTEALERLITRYWEPLTFYAFRMLGDMALAEDVVQEVFIRIWAGRVTWRPRSVRAYLLYTTRTNALEQLRSRHARRQREQIRSGEPQGSPPTPAEVFEASEVRSEVDAAIQAFPERRREAFTLAYLKRLSYAETAEVMGISAKTVGHHVSAALVQLRERLRLVLVDHFPRASS